MRPMQHYAELHAASAFSFLRAASAPAQLARRAAALGLGAVALCDRDGLYGMPRFVEAAREAGLKAIVGCELTMEDGAVLPVLVRNRTGYHHLCALLSAAHLRAPKGGCAISWEELPAFAEGLVALTGDEEGPLQRHGPAALERLRRIFGPGHLYVELQRHRRRGEERRVRNLVALARAAGLPLLATNGVRYATGRGRAVLDLFTCLREHTTLDAAGARLCPNSERRLKSPAAMAELFADLPEALANSVALANSLEFRLEDLGYAFPSYQPPDGSSQEAFLRRVTFEGARARYGPALPEKVARQLEHELRVIGHLGFAGYFLIVWDIVNFCRSEDILVQGRGSAANSAVCFCLGITAVDAVAHELLFERFLNEGRRTWPDIDLDLPSGARRERVIQEIYRRFGRLGAAMTANVITYRGRSAAREIGKALALPENLAERFSALFASGDFPHGMELGEQLARAGLPARHPRAPAFASLYQAIRGLPRHLGQHSGGMIICEQRLGSLVPLENASMAGRSVAQWDKDDCAGLGIIKVDLLGLGMMSVLQDTVELCRSRGREIDLARIPKDDPATYDLLCRADTVGVFQVESRAQMATLPRMRPRVFYDVAIEVAIIRPGPIQGGLMHPYLERRSGAAPVTYIDPRLEPALRRTLGVPLFQEQILQIAMTMAGFSGAEAEQLRRAVSFQREPERLEKVLAHLREKMAARGVTPAQMDEVTGAISSFALYGFPESHAISFALLAYASAWMKVHCTEEFFACLLNNQPMGFYSPESLLQDARRRGVRIRPVCLARSEWRCTLPPGGGIRLGLCMVKGLQRAHAEALLAARPFSSMADLQARGGLDADELRALAGIGALNTLAAHRRDALWAAARAPLPGDDLFNQRSPIAPMSPTSPLPPMSAAERLETDYRHLELSTGPHAMALVRPQLQDVWRAGDLSQARDGDLVRVAGAVICRQRPGTAKGILFLSLEDESGIANAIVAPELFERLRLLIVHEPFLVVEGVVQKRHGVIHLRAHSIAALRHGALAAGPSHDFH